MLFNRNNLQLYQLADKGSSRPELTGVLFKRDRTLATDSYILAEVVNSDEMLRQANDLPDLPDKGKLLLNFAKKGYIIPASSVKKALGNIPVNPQLPVLEYARFCQPFDPLTSKIATTNLERADVVNVKNIDADYPDTSRVMPDEQGEKAYKFISLNRKYLKKIADLFNSMEMGDTIQIGIKDTTSPVYLKGESKTGQKIKGLIMPIRS